MELCEDGHDLICYESRKCPACELLDTISNMEDQIYDLNEKNKELEDKVNGTNT